jgi:hypothetical protein
MKSLTLSVAITSVLALSLFSATAAEEKAMDASKLPPVATKTGVSYATDIKPLLEKSCFKCHGPEKQKSKLRLDSLEAAIKGGENGPDIIAGKSDKSPIVYAVAHAGEEDDFMPPPKSKDTPALTKEQVSLVRAWIDQGAK